MERERTNILDVILFMSLTVLFTGLAALSWRANEIIGGIVTTMFAGVLGAFVISDIRKGVRPPNRWERFKAWMTLRPLIAGGVGMLVLSALPTYGSNLFTYLSHEARGAIVFVFLAVWAVVLFYSLWKAPHRYESDAAYRRRVGYEGEIR